MVLLKILAGVGAGLLFVAVMAAAVAGYREGANQTGSYFRDYRLVAEVWSPASGQWTATGALPSPRDSHHAILLSGDQVLVVGGAEGGGAGIDSAALWDPRTGTWSSEVMTRHPRNMGSLVSIGDGGVLAIGGWDDERTVQSKAALRDASGKWTSLDSPLDQVAAAARLADGRVLVVGMEGHSATFDGRVWTAAEDAAQAVGTFYGDILPLADGRVLLLQKNTSKEVTFAQTFDPKTRGWTPVEALQRHFDGREGSPDIVGLFLAGAGRVGILDAREPTLWDPRTDAVTTVAVPVPWEAAWTSLGENKLLIAGGRDDDGIAATVVDVASGSSTPTGKLQFPRSRATLTRLSDGRVLAVGGGELGVTAPASSVPSLIVAALVVLMGLGGAFLLWRLDWFSTGAKIAFVVGIALGCGAIALAFAILEAIGGAIKG